MRVISVLPSATEIVFALGHGAELIGRSAECDYPRETAQLPVVMRPRTWDADRPSREIDARVQSVRSRGESLYELDLGLLAELQPDLLITQDLCGVCSVTEEEVVAGCRAAGVAPRILSLAPRRLGEVWGTFDQVAEALGDRPAAERLRAELPDPSVSASSLRGPRVAVIEWLDPPILAGLWTPDIVALAGGAPVGPRAGEVGQRTTWRALAELGIDLVLLSPCSFSVARTRAELADPGIAAGVRSLRPPLGTFLADEAYFSRPGPRLAEGVRLVRTLLTGGTERLSLPFESWTSDAPEVSA